MNIPCELELRDFEGIRVGGYDVPGLAQFRRAQSRGVRRVNIGRFAEIQGFEDHGT